MQHEWEGSIETSRATEVQLKMVPRVRLGISNGKINHLLVIKSFQHFGPDWNIQQLFDGFPRCSV